MPRPALGVLAIALVIIGALAAFTGVFGGESLWWGGVTLRAGAILGVFWLVLPRARALPRAVWVGIMIFAVFLAARPRLVLLGLALAFVAMVVVAIAQRRAASTK